MTKAERAKLSTEALAEFIEEAKRILPSATRQGVAAFLRQNWSKLPKRRCLVAGAIIGMIHSDNVREAQIEDLVAKRRRLNKN